MPASQFETPRHIQEIIQAIALMHAQHHVQSTLAERTVDLATTYVARPKFLLALIMASTIWMAANILIGFAGGLPPDPPPFIWLDLFFSTSALMTAVMILSSQRRADRLADLREQLTLETSLLTENMTRKIIELLEELRRDSPAMHYRDRKDPEADQMAMRVDPNFVLAAIESETRETEKAIIRETPSAIQR